MLLHSRIRLDCFSQAARHLVPRLAIEDPPRLLLVPAAPLLEKERHLRSKTLVPQIDRPPGINWARSRSRFAADDHPVDAGEVQGRPVPEEGLKREEPSLNQEQIGHHRLGCWISDELAGHFEQDCGQELRHRRLQPDGRTALDI